MTCNNNGNITFEDSLTNPELRIKGFFVDYNLIKLKKHPPSTNTIKNSTPNSYT